MSSISAPAYDPTSTAQALAQKTTAAAQQILTNQNATASATAKALASLSSAISAFQSSLTSLTGAGKSMLTQRATLSDTTIGTATAKSTAAAGSYSLFVDQLATASQVSYTPQDGVAAKGTLTIALGPNASSTTNFTVDLSNADTDQVGGLSVREVAIAINNASGNAGKVSAGVVTVNGAPQLVLTSNNTGAANTVWASSSQSLDVNGNPIPDYDLGTRTEVTKAQDAIIHYGGNAITNASNTFSNIDGVSMTFTRAQAVGDNPFTLTVSRDSGGTTSNVQAFVDAYNKLKSAIDDLVDAGDPTNNQAAACLPTMPASRRCKAAWSAWYGLWAARRWPATASPLRATAR